MKWARAWLLLCVIMLLLDVGCEQHTPSQKQSPPIPAGNSGHEKMLALLAQIKQRIPQEHIYQGNREVRNFEEQLSLAYLNKHGGEFEKWFYHLRLGEQLLYLDRIAEGIGHLTQAYQLLPKIADVKINSYANRTRFYLGVAYMRMGETQNCCLRHNSDSCILPIRGGGIHTQQHGSKQAVRYFLEVLRHPADSADDELQFHEPARWLLNIAYMTLDKYPDQVPPEYLLPTETFESEIAFPRFANVAPKLDLNTFNLSGGAIVDDFDGDDYLDIFTSTCDPSGQIRFFRNNRDGTFSDKTNEAGLIGLYGGLNLVHADYDNDGDADVFVLRGAWLGKFGQHPNSLLRNNGDGTFADVTFEAGLGELHFPTKTAAWADYDNDGDLDLFVGNESTVKSEYSGLRNDDRQLYINAPCQLFRNNGDGTFTDVADKAGLAEVCFSMGAVWGDYNGDRYPDLYLSKGGPNSLYRNNRDGTFTDVASSLAVARPDSSFPAWFWDFDNDGALDIFVGCSSGPVSLISLRAQGKPAPENVAALGMSFQSGQNELMCLYRGDGKGGFQEVAQECNLSYPAQPMGANFGDLNNDGYLDFYLATGDVWYWELRPNVMFLNQGGKRFANVTMSGGFGHLQKGHGVSFADLDNDGDQDVYVQMGGAFVGDKYSDALFENPGFDNHWITLKLVGKQSNRSAIGARIRIDVAEGGKTRSIYRHVNSGGSFGANPLRQMIGLGKADMIQSLEVYWPTSDQKQTFRDVNVDQMLQIVEGDARYTTISVDELKLGGERSESSDKQ